MCEDKEVACYATSRQKALHNQKGWPGTEVAILVRCGNCEHGAMGNDIAIRPEAPDTLGLKTILALSVGQRWAIWRLDKRQK